MRYVLALAIALLLAVLEVSFMPYFRVLDVTPNLILIFAVSWTVVRGQDEAFVVIPMSGLVRDLTTSDPVGTSPLAMAPIILLAAIVQLRSIDTDFVPTVVLVAVGTLTYGIIGMIVLAMAGDSVGWFDGLFKAVLPLSVVNALFTPAVYLPVRWLGTRSTARILGPGRITSPL